MRKVFAGPLESGLNPGLSLTPFGFKFHVSSFLNISLASQFNYLSYNKREFQRQIELRGVKKYSNNDITGGLNTYFFYWSLDLVPWQTNNAMLEVSAFNGLGIADLASTHTRVNQKDADYLLAPPIESYDVYNYYRYADTNRDAIFFGFSLKYHRSFDKKSGAFIETQLMHIPDIRVKTRELNSMKLINKKYNSFAGDYFIANVNIGFYIALY